MDLIPEGYNKVISPAEVLYKVEKNRKVTVFLGCAQKFTRF